MTEFEQYILNNHPDPDTLLVLDSDVFKQMCKLATEYAKEQVNIALGSESFYCSTKRGCLEQ